MSEDPDIPWVVGRGDGGCYVENAPPLRILGADLGEQEFRTEAEALRYAVACEEETIAPLKANLRDLKKRLRKAERRAG